MYTRRLHNALFLQVHHHCPLFYRLHYQEGQYLLLDQDLRKFSKVNYIDVTEFYYLLEDDLPGQQIAAPETLVCPLLEEVLNNLSQLLRQNNA
jgi:hypothetical protein